ncbi:hypothetical protein EPA93_05865 [Ktedonosporobacter rubrisoli]|uniref:MmyB-like transcription regulator ligand binding domain-containing protein n=1 Tax=Ktedonosporobacter rubrisoli TaxID=2509675 RepID=A0A4P6JK83_KTERU|nr:hypothetical protein [Ktedonosporobacter rubrisoli]QBD75554.1 hypothetical protein EPA93_05865 [Ktedonosporobacter rubrisoli]
MIDSKPGILHTSEVLYDVLNEIEILRIRRQKEVKEQAHPHLKRFTQQELNDEACPTYKNLLIGRSHRVPGRTTIVQIAQYLECSAAERNDLLLAARYLPESLELKGSQLKQALEQAQNLMETLPYPALILTHALKVEAVNDIFRQVFAFPPLHAIPRQHRHLLSFFFHPDLSIRASSTFNEQEVKAWQTHALQGIQLFKQSNVLYQFEPWYKELVEQLCAVADFRTYWERDSEVLDKKALMSKSFLSRHAMTGELLPIQLRRVHISVGSYRYPNIAAFLPLDEAARTFFVSLGSAERPASSSLEAY